MRHRMAAERMQYPPVHWSPTTCKHLATTIKQCADQSSWNIAALAIEPTHLHLLITYAPLNLGRTCKWLTQQMTKTVHTHTNHTGPVFAKGRWATYLFDDKHWKNAMHYIQNHPGAHDMHQ